MAIFNSEQLEGLAEFYADIIDSFGVPCKLVYMHKFEAGTPSLQFADNTYTQNVGLSGAPIQSEGAQVGGENLVAQQYDETITLVVDWTLKGDRIFGKVISQPYALIRTHGLLTDLPKIRRAVSMEVNLPGQPITKGIYKVYGEGSDIFSIVKGKHFNCFWERVA